MRELVTLRALFEDRKLGPAREEYQRLVHTGEADAETHLVGAKVHRLLGNLIAARGAAERAKAAGPTGALAGQVTFAYAAILRELGDIALALEQFEECIGHLADYGEMTPFLSGVSWYNYGLALRQAKRYQEAMDAYETAGRFLRAEGLVEFLCQSLQNLAWASCYAGDLPRAEAALEESAGLVPNDALRWHQRIGMAFLEAARGNERIALDLCEEITRSSEPVPADVRSHAFWLSGRTAMRLGLVDVARGLAKQAVDHALLASGENRCLHDASELLREISAAHGTG